MDQVRIACQAQTDIRIVKVTWRGRVVIEDTNGTKATVRQGERYRVRMGADLNSNGPDLPLPR
jgi:hypothetical protein